MKPNFSEGSSSPHNSLFRQFQAAFENVTGLPLGVLEPGEFHIPEGAPDFCQIMGLTPRTCQECQDAHSRLQEPEAVGSQTSECFAGMTSTSVPVRMKGKVVAYLHTGHVFLGDGAKANWEKLRRFLLKQGLDAGACERALEATRTADPGHYESAIHLLEIFACQLSDSLPPTELQRSYPAIEQALKIVSRDLEQEWPLVKIAGRVKMNPSYFSDVFRKSTGETFVSCLARLRTERACRLLESTQLGIGEIAFASGFRSLSQFNRVFKRFCKVSPATFRQNRRMHPAGSETRKPAPPSPDDTNPSNSEAAASPG